MLWTRSRGAVDALDPVRGAVDALDPVQRCSGRSGPSPEVQWMLWTWSRGAVDPPELRRSVDPVQRSVDLCACRFSNESANRSQCRGQSATFTQPAS
jgi:hypothetical protein